MNDLQITILILGNVVFAITFYTIGRTVFEKKYDIKLPSIPRSLHYYRLNDNLDNYYRQLIIWIPSMILAIFCSAMLVGIVGGQVYLPKK